MEVLSGKVGIGIVFGIFSVVFQLHMLINQLIQIVGGVVIDVIKEVVFRNING